MVQNAINFYKGNGNIEIKPELVGYYLCEFALIYKIVSQNKHMEHLKRKTFFNYSDKNNIIKLSCLNLIWVEDLF